MKNNQNNNKKPEDSFSFLELYAECIVEAYNEFEDFAKKDLGPKGRQMWKFDKKYRKVSACCNDCRILLKNDTASPVLLAYRSCICIGCWYIAVLYKDSKK